MLDKKTGAVKIPKGQPYVLLPSQFGFPEKLSMEVYRELLRERYSGQPEGTLESDTEGRQVDSHEGWDESDVADAQIRDWVDRIDAKKAWGNLQADLVAGLRAAQKAEVSWEKELRYLLGHMDSSLRRHTLKKPSRRVGYPWSGTTKQYMDNPLFAPDTSASVDDANLAKFLCELNRLAARRPVDFMSWSVGMTLDKPIRWDKKRVSLDFKGRGGTDPNPMIQYAAEQGYKQLVMLTDGEFFGEVVTHPKVRILWVITCDGTTKCLPPGSAVVQMKHKG
jgi:predicted metal-dependent peptidase